MAMPQKKCTKILRDCVTAEMPVICAISFLDWKFWKRSNMCSMRELMPFGKILEKTLWPNRPSLRLQSPPSKAQNPRKIQTEGHMNARWVRPTRI